MHARTLATVRSQREATRRNTTPAVQLRRRRGQNRRVPDACPCGSAQVYEACCGRLHRGQPAASAEQLMRSRYSGYALGNEVYLLETWHATTRPDALRLDPSQRWTGLQIVRTDGGGIFDATGVVEFRAHYRSGKRDEVLHETSRFVRENGRWSYVGPLTLA
jgi:SEC-C motif-containing protein